MIRHNLGFAALAFCLFLCASVSAQDTDSDTSLSGDVSLSVSMTGYTQATSYNKMKYRFNLSNSADVSAASLSGAMNGEISGDDFTKVLKNLFNKAPENNASTPTVSGTLKGKKEGETVKLSGNITVKWSVKAGGGTGGTKYLKADIKGNMTVKDGKISSFSISGENVKVGGDWNYGPGTMKMIGGGKLSISSQ